ncbi:unnamed protein product [Brassica oleracea]
MRARLWFPIPSVIVEFLNRLEVSISQISPSGIMHLVGLLVLGYERGIELTAEYLEAFLALPRVGTDRLYGFRPRTFMEVLILSRRSWKEDYVYFVVHNPVPPFPEDLCVVRNLLHGGPLCWGLLLSREGPCCGRDSSISFQLVD